MYPSIQTILSSFTDLSLVRPFETEKFVGFRNYLRAWEDPLTLVTLQNSAVYLFGSLTLEFALGFVIALCLNEEIRLRGALRTISLVPWFIPSVVAAYVWAWVYNPAYGPLNSALEQLGIIQPTQIIGWLSNPSLTMFSVTIVSVWRDFPFHTVMLLAGLQVIPATQYEAAIVDGANVFNRFRHVTLPNMRYIVGVDLILSAVWLFKRIDIFYVMTEGGPVNSTLVFPLFIYKVGFHQYDLGFAGALAVIMFVILLANAILYMRILRID
jgi:multiple sugar transport system permease protein